MSKKNKLLRVHCLTIDELIINEVSQRLAIAQATGLSPHYFEPHSLPCVPFEFDAIVDGVRYEKLQGELKFGEDRGQATVKIDFPDTADEQKWIDECYNKLQAMVFKQLG
jgi:hypothetical protein